MPPKTNEEYMREIRNIQPAHHLVYERIEQILTEKDQELQKARAELLEEMNAFTFEACPYEGTMMRAFIRSKQSELDQPTV